MEVANLLVKKVFTSWILLSTELKDPEILKRLLDEIWIVISGL